MLYKLVFVQLDQPRAHIRGAAGVRAFFKDFPVGGGGHFLKKDLSVK